VTFQEPTRLAADRAAAGGQRRGRPILAVVDSLRRAWEEALESSTAEERTAAQARRLRRHAVETGIIERLYEVDPTRRWSSTAGSGPATSPCWTLPTTAT
jgi:hypothetical protein